MNVRTVALARSLGLGARWLNTLMLALLVIGTVIGLRTPARFGTPVDTMGTMEAKLYAVGSDDELIPHRHRRRAAIDFASPQGRLVVSTDGSAMDLALEMIGDRPGPFRVLIVLLIPRGPESVGRYGSTEPLERWQLMKLIEEHRELLEVDGRLHFWISTESGDLLLVYDRHDILYVYGPVEQWGATLAARGFIDERPEIPVPHGHQYESELDEQLRHLLDSYDWHLSPLQEGDDD